MVDVSGLFFDGQDVALRKAGAAVWFLVNIMDLPSEELIPPISFPVNRGRVNRGRVNYGGSESPTAARPGVFLVTVRVYMYISMGKYYNVKA